MDKQTPIVQIMADDLTLNAVWSNGQYQVLITGIKVNDSGESYPESVQAKFSAREFGAILALFSPFEDENFENDQTLHTLYAIAEEALIREKVPDELRPIP